MALIPKSWLTGLSQQALTTGKALSPQNANAIRQGQIQAQYEADAQNQYLGQQQTQVNNQNAFWQGQLGNANSQLALQRQALSDQAAYEEQQQAAFEAAQKAAQDQYDKKYAQDQEAINNANAQAKAALQQAQDAQAQGQLAATVGGGIGALGAGAQVYRLLAGAPAAEQAGTLPAGAMAATETPQGAILGSWEAAPQAASAPATVASPYVAANADFAGVGAQPVVDSIYGADTGDAAMGLTGTPAIESSALAGETAATGGALGGVAGEEMLGLTGAPAIESAALAGETAAAGAGGGLGMASLAGAGLALTPLAIAMAMGMPDPVSAIMANHSLQPNEAKAQMYGDLADIKQNTGAGGSWQDAMNFTGDKAGANYDAWLKANSKNNSDLANPDAAWNGMQGNMAGLDRALRWADTSGLDAAGFKKLIGQENYSPFQLAYLAQEYNADPFSHDKSPSLASQEVQNMGSFFNDPKAPWNAQSGNLGALTQQNIQDYFGGNYQGSSDSGASAPTGGVYDQVSGLGSQLLGRDWKFPSDWPTGLTTDQYTNMIKNSSEYLNKQQQNV